MYWSVYSTSFMDHGLILTGAIYLFEFNRSLSKTLEGCHKQELKGFVEIFCDSQAIHLPLY